jgi:hypothetical protein
MTVVKVVDSRDIEPLRDMKGEATPIQEGTCLAI